MSHTHRECPPKWIRQCETVERNYCPACGEAGMDRSGLAKYAACKCRMCGFQTYAGCPSPAQIRELCAALQAIDLAAFADSRPRYNGERTGHPHEARFVDLDSPVPPSLMETVRNDFGLA